MSRILRSAIQAAAQVISREAGLEADLDAGAVRGEREPRRLVVDQRVDVGLRGRDAARRLCASALRSAR